MAGSRDGSVLVGGEAPFDLVLDEGGDLRAHAGGGPFNTARTLGRLGRPVGYLGRLSRDRFGATPRSWCSTRTSGPRSSPTRMPTATASGGSSPGRTS